jgi:hypothetical protein
MAISFTQVVDLGNQRITSLASPSASTDAVNKSYVDNMSQGLDWKASVRAASTGNITLTSPGTTIDGVTMANGDRFLAKDQTTGSANGIYVFNGSGAAATRATDADTATKLTTGATTSVEEGTVNAGKTYVLITAEPITLGTTSLSFTLMNGGSTTYVAGNGLTLTGSTFDVGAGTGISVAADTVSIDTSVVARKYAANVGDGSSTSIAVTHGLGTRDVNVQVYTNGTNYDTVFCEVQRTSTTQVTLVFGSAPASNAYRVVVIG